MTKKLTTALAVALLPLLASAEITTGTIQVSGSSTLGFTTGSAEVTTNDLGLVTVDKTDISTFGLDTSVLFYLTPMIGVGLDLGYSSQAYDHGTYTNTFTDVFIGPKAGVDAPIAERISVFGDLALGYAKEGFEHKDAGGTVTQDATGWGFRLGGGLKYFPVPALSLDAGLAYRYSNVSYSAPGFEETTKRGEFGLILGLSGYFGGR